jgi:hypothetical protein
MADVQTSEVVEKLAPVAGLQRMNNFNSTIFVRNKIYVNGEDV